MKKFKGIYPALVTPFDKNGRVDESALGKLIEVNILKGVSGFYIGGSTGESYLLSMEERKQVLEVALNIVHERVDVIASIGMFATEHGIELAEHAQKAGAAAVSSVPPFYFPFQMTEYMEYYKELAASVELPLIIYNIPAMSGVKFLAKDIERLFAYEKIAGVKHTSYDLFQMQRLIKKHPEKSVFIGHDEIFLSAYAMGADAAIGSTFNFMAEKFVEMTELFEQNKLEEALEIQNQANAIIEVLCKIGVFKGVKMALKMQGMDCGCCRKPFQPLRSEEEKQLEAVLLKYGCL